LQPGLLILALGGCMAKDEFICKNCKAVKSSTTWLFIPCKKYKCPKCGMLCSDCVDEGVIFSSKCKKCGSKVLTYRWGRKGWEKE